MDTTTRDLMPRSATPMPIGYYTGVPDQNRPFAPPTRTAIVVGMIAIILFVGSFVAWSVLAPIARAAIAPGTIEMEGSRKTIQSLEGGIIRQILVKDGDAVKAGQVLMRLADQETEATASSLRDQRWQLLAQKARLDAEAKKADHVVFPEELQEAAANSPFALAAMTSEQSLFQTRQFALQSQLDVLRLRRDEANSQFASFAAQLTSLDRQLNLIDTEAGAVLHLLKKGLETNPHYWALERTEASLVGNRGDLIGQRARAESQVAEATAQMATTLHQHEQEIADQIAQNQVKLADVSERLKAAEAVNQRRVVVAPADGTVFNQHFFTIGGVVRPGEPIMDLQPAHDTMIAVVHVTPQDIDDVHLDMTAHLRFVTFDSRKTPELVGKVTYVAPDVTSDPAARQSFYIAHVDIPEDQLKRLPSDEHLVTGLPVQAQMVAGSRSLAAYIVEPLVNSFNMAMRER